MHNVSCTIGMYFFNIYNLICGNKTPTRCNRWYLLQILLQACNKICNKYHLLHLVGVLFPHIDDDARSKSLQIYNLRHFQILQNFTYTAFETVFVLFHYCVFVVWLCFLLSCILLSQTCFISICCLKGVLIYEINMHLCMYWASCKVPVILVRF